ncbi:MAG: NYN domain-containing protein [Simkania sp.]|nr:NYN domain-containing protein [Simkania sp.]
MHYYIDGYNLLFKLSHNWRLDLRTQRQALIQAFNETIEELNLSLTVVFDGAEMPKGDYTRGHWKHVEVVYTHEGLSADEYIIHQLEQQQHSERYTVVTADRELLNKAKVCGACVMEIGQFIQLLVTRKQKKKQRTRVPRPAVDTKDHIQRLQKIFEERLQQGEDL